MKAALFGFIHNCLAHPLMSLSFAAAWSLRFHDWTAKWAWPEECES